MTLNFSQNPQYINQPQNSNFGATNIPVQEPLSFTILKGMGVPTSKDEFVKFAPFFGVSLLFSKLVSSFAVIASRVNPFSKGNEAITAGESFEKSLLGRVTKKIDDFLFPVLNRNKDKFTAVKKKASSWTPQWLKNLGEKFSIGVTPKNNMALFNYKGATHCVSNSFLELFAKIKPEELVKLGIKQREAEALQLVAQSGMKAGTRKSVLGAVESIAAALKNVKAKDLQNLVLANGKKAQLLNELNKARAFIAPTSKTWVSKYLQKGMMYLSEAAGGGVIGGALFGIIMNSLFLATTVKRTWEAPWKEKLSTFMEGFFYEFGGVYLTMVLGSRLTYKLLGLKNADKTKAELEAISKLTKTIDADKEGFKVIEKFLAGVEKGKIKPTAEMIKNVLLGMNPKDASPECAKLINSFLKAIKKNGIVLGANEIEILKQINTKEYAPAFKKLINQLANSSRKSGFLRKFFSKSGQLTQKQATNLIEQIAHLNQTKGAGINSAIDNLAKMREFKPRAGFVKNLLYRPLSWVGNFLTTGLESLPTKVGVKGVSKAGIAWHKFLNGFKWLGGFPIRFILVMAVVTPPLTNFLGKFSHFVFGKPTKSIMDEEKKEENQKAAQAQMQPQMQAGQQQTMDKMMAYSQLTKQIGELRNAYETQQQNTGAVVPQQPVTPQQSIVQPKPQFLTSQVKTQQSVNKSQPKTVEAKNLSPATYVPSVAVSKFVDEGAVSEIGQKLAQSEGVERYAQRELDALHTKNDAFDF